MTVVIKRRIVGAIIGIVMILAAVLVAASTGGPDSAEASASQKDVKEAQVQLFVDPATVSMDNCNALVAKYDGKVATVDDAKTPVFDVGAVKPVGTSADTRLWSNAVNTPLKPQTLEAARATVCSDPAQAAMVMNGMAKVKIGDQTVAALNKSWIKAQGSPAAINDWAQSCLVNDVETHFACAKTMAYTSELLGRFHDDGVQNVATSWNYSLAGPVVSSVPEFALSAKQYEGHFVVVSYTAKEETFCVKVGVNVGKDKANGGDQRLAGIPCVAKRQPKPSKTTSTPGRTPTGTSTTPGRTTTTPPRTTTTTPPTTRTTTTPGGKHYSDAPTPDAPVKSCPDGQYLDRYTNTCKSRATSTSTPSGTSTTVGQGDSGPGATNTVAPPATNSPAPAPPTTTSPPTTVPPPTD